MLLDNFENHKMVTPFLTKDMICAVEERALKLNQSFQDAAADAVETFLSDPENKIVICPADTDKMRVKALFLPVALVNRIQSEAAVLGCTMGSVLRSALQAQISPANPSYS